MARSTETLLKNKFGQSARIAVLGIGSELRSDDAAGIVVCRLLKEARSKRLGIFEGGTAPENITGELIRFKPDELILVDGAHFSGKPGEIRVLEPDTLDAVDFSTHTLPPKIIVDYLNRSISCRLTIVGIQPKSLEVCGKMTREVSRSCKELARVLKKACTAKRSPSRKPKA